MKKQFDKLIQGLIQQEKTTLAHMEYDRPVVDGLVFLPQSYDEFKKAYDGAADKDKAEGMVKVIDYIANPAILKKCYNVSNALRIDLGKLYENKELFAAVIEKITLLEQGSYAYALDPVQKLVLDKINEFMEGEAKALAESEVLIARNGVGVDLKEVSKAMLQADKTLEAGEHFLKVAIKDIPNSPRLDQVPLFQSSTHFATPEAVAQLSGSAFDKGVFLYQLSQEYNVQFCTVMDALGKSLKLKYECQLESNIFRIA